MADGQEMAKTDGEASAPSFRVEFWKKAHPILLHLAISLLLSFAFTLGGVALYGSEYVLENVPLKLGLTPPDKSIEHFFGLFATGDSWLMLVLWYAFLLYTLLEVLTGMATAAIDAGRKWKKGVSVEEQT